jgi:hypothetical protein
LAEKVGEDPKLEDDFPLHCGLKLVVLGNKIKSIKQEFVVILEVEDGLRVVNLYPANKLGMGWPFIKHRVWGALVRLSIIVQVLSKS